MGYDSCNKSLYNNDNLPPGFNDHSNDRRYNSFLKHEELRTKREVETEIEGYRKKIESFVNEIKGFQLMSNYDKIFDAESGIDYCYDQINKLNQEKTK